MKFIVPVEGGEEAYEVKPILRSFIDAEWLSQFKDALKAYSVQLAKGAVEDEEDEGHE